MKAAPLHSQRRLSRLVLPALILSIGTASLLRAQQQQPPSGAAPPVDRILAFTGNASSWTWLHQKGNEAVLYTGGPTSRTEVARGSGWSDVAPDGGDALMLNQDKGELLKIGLRAGSQPEVLAKGLSKPGGLFISEQKAYWLEVSQGSSPLPFIPTAGPMLELRARDASGQIRTINHWPASDVKGMAPRGGDILAIADGAAYVKVRRPASTELVKFPLDGGEPQRLVAESGDQQAVLNGKELYWTAPSDEAGSGASILMLRRLGRNGEPEPLTEWLRYGGTLFKSRGGVFFGDRELCRIPSSFGEAEIVDVYIPGRLTTDGEHVVILEGPGAPKIAPRAAGRE